MTKLLAQEILTSLQREELRIPREIQMQCQVMEALETGNSEKIKIEWQEDDYSVLVWITQVSGRKVYCRIPGETLRPKLMKRPDERLDEWDTFVNGGI